MEAMASGMPVIAAACGGNAEIVPNRERRQVIGAEGLMTYMPPGAKFPHAEWAEVDLDRVVVMLEERYAEWSSSSPMLLDCSRVNRKHMQDNHTWAHAAQEVLEAMGPE
jgi:glycosyltransferase involved in cell wall biosynthesis